MSDINEFLKSLGMGGDKNEVKWHDIVRPSTVCLILGRKGEGKSALGYFLMEEMSKHNSLLPVVINLPREKQPLLPESFVIRSQRDIPSISDAIVLIDEGTTMIPAGQRELEELIKGYVALSRQRNQIILLVFHASSDVGSRILRGMDAILIKEPSMRQIQHGAKDSWWKALLTEAKERFESLRELGANTKQYTFVDSEVPEFRGILPNPLPSFWTDALSKAWANVDTTIATKPEAPQLELFQPQLGKPRAWHADDPEKQIKYVVTPQMEREAVAVEEHLFDNSGYVIMEHPPTRLRWVKQIY